MNTIITKASEATLDRLVEHCVDSMELYLKDLAVHCAKNNDFSLYRRVTGQNAPITLDESTSLSGIQVRRDDKRPGHIVVSGDYFNDSFEMSLPIPNLDSVKKAGITADDFLKSYLTKVIFAKAIHPGGPISRNFEYARHFIKDTRGRVTGITPEGKGEVFRLAQNVSEQLIPYVMKQENRGEGRIFSAKLKLHGDWLSDCELRPIILDPEHYICISDRLPDTKGMSAADREEAYESSSMRFAVAAMASNMVANPKFRDYFQEIEISVGGRKVRTYTFSEKVLAELGNESVPTTTAKDPELQQVVRIFDKLTDRITEAMLGLEEHEAVPFYLEFGVTSEKGADGLQEPVVRETKQVYVASNAKTNPLMINVPKVEGGSLERKDLEVVAKDIVHKVMNYVIAEKMAALNHPKLLTCFLPNTDPKLSCKYVITEQGAELLEDMIKDIVGEVAISTLMMRETLPEHFSGYRARVDPTISQDGLVEKVDQIAEYFAPVAKQFQYKINPLTLQPGSERPETFERLGKDIVVAVMYNNMGATRHPAFDSYFAKAGGKAALTEAGENALGKIVEKNAKQMAAELSKLPGNGSGNYTIAYRLEFADADFRIAYSPGTDDSRVRALKARAGIVPRRG